MLEYKECSQRIADLREYFGLLEDYDLMHTVQYKGASPMVHPWDEKWQDI